MIKTDKDLKKKDKDVLQNVHKKVMKNKLKDKLKKSENKKQILNSKHGNGQSNTINMPNLTASERPKPSLKKDVKTVGELIMDSFLII